MSPTAFTKINHISVQVSDVSVSRAFYLRLGFEEIERPDFDFDGAWFLITPNTQLHIIGGLTLPVNSGTRSTHFAVSVGNLNSFAEYISKERIPHESIKIRPDGVRQLFVIDPDGYYWEINDLD